MDNPAWLAAVYERELECIAEMTGVRCCPPGADAGCGCRGLSPAEYVAVVVEQLDVLRRFALAAADHIYAAHEVLARLAERRVVVLSEADYPLEG